jgi:hypothetical protein
VITSNREVIGAGIIDYLIDIYDHYQKSVITDIIPRNRCFIKEMAAISSITYKSCRKRTGNQHFPDDLSITGPIPINQSILYGTGCNSSDYLEIVQKYGR